MSDKPDSDIVWALGANTTTHRYMPPYQHGCDIHVKSYDTNEHEDPMAMIVIAGGPLCDRKIFERRVQHARNWMQQVDKDRRIHQRNVMRGNYQIITWLYVLMNNETDQTIHSHRRGQFSFDAWDVHDLHKDVDVDEYDVDEYDKISERYLHSLRSKLVALSDSPYDNWCDTPRSAHRDR